MACDTVQDVTRETDGLVLLENPVTCRASPGTRTGFCVSPDSVQPSCAAVKSRTPLCPVQSQGWGACSPASSLLPPLSAVNLKLCSLEKFFPVRVVRHWNMFPEKFLMPVVKLFRTAQRIPGTGTSKSDFNVNL